MTQRRRRSEPLLTTDVMGHVRRRGVLPWGTADEVNFLRGLGEWSDDRRTPRRVLLRRYLASLRSRADWADIDEMTVRQELDAMLRKERA